MSRRAAGVGSVRKGSRGLQEPSGWTLLVAIRIKMPSKLSPRARSSHRDSEGNLVRKHPTKNIIKNFGNSSLPDFKEFILAQILEKIALPSQNE